MTNKPIDQSMPCRNVVETLEVLLNEESYLVDCVSYHLKHVENSTKRLETVRRAILKRKANGDKVGDNPIRGNKLSGWEAENE